MQVSARFCSTPVGRVAYAAVGAGPTLICDPGWVTDLRGQLRLWHFQRFLETLARRFTVIRYDRPGCGMSDRGELQLSLEDQIATVLSVADAVGADRFHMFGAGHGGQLAAAVAARHPGRVGRLALYGTCAAGRDLTSELIRSLVVAMVGEYWGRGMKEIATALVSDPSTEELSRFTAFQQASASPQAAAALVKNYYESDISSLLPSVTAPTLVLHREADPSTPFELGRTVSSLVPGATFIPLPGTSQLFYAGEWQPVADAIVDFLSASSDAELPLTDRELEVAALTAEGLTNQSIARHIGVAPRTAETHMQNIRRKLGVHSRAQIAAWATTHRVGRPGPT